MKKYWIYFYFFSRRPDILYASLLSLIKAKGRKKTVVSSSCRAQNNEGVCSYFNLFVIYDGAH